MSSTRFDDLEDSLVAHLMDGHNKNHSETVILINSMDNMELLQNISWILKEKGICPNPIEE